MLRGVGSIKDLKVHAIDGRIGHVEDCYFDDENWTVRYLVIDTGGWLPGRSVLISPSFLNGDHWDREALEISLTKQQVENSPGLETAQPITRRYEAEYMDHFGYPYYWEGPGLWGSGMFPSALTASPVPFRAQASPQIELTDAHLRSTNEVNGYRIEAVDGELGHVADFIIDPETWSIRYLEANTGNWWLGRKILIAPPWIGQVRWAHSSVDISLTREQMKNAPEYREWAMITRNYERELHDYYNRVPYWAAG